MWPWLTAAIALHAALALALGRAGSSSSISTRTQGPLPVDIEVVAPALPHVDEAPVDNPVVSPIDIPRATSASVRSTRTSDVSAAVGPTSELAPDPVKTAPLRFTVALAPSVGAAPSATLLAGRVTPAPVEETATPSTVSTPARLVSSLPPSYPPTARDEGIEADVRIEIVVDASGRVVDARAIEHAGYGFDEAALAAIRAYRFSPAMRAGRVVRVRMPWTVEFRLR